MKSIVNWLLALLAAATLTSLLLLSKPVSLAVLSGVSLCLKVLIPSMFVFLILSGFFMKTRMLDCFIRPFGVVCKKLFHVDASLGTLLLMSVLCGYPVGARLLSDLVLEGRLSRQTANRMLCFCVNAGPAFLIGGVCVPLFSSVSLGLVLFFSHLCAFFGVGILSGIGKSVEVVQASPERLPLSDALVDATHAATRSMAGICAFVILFSGILGLLYELGFFALLQNETLCAVVTGSLEVSNGVAACKALSPRTAFLVITGITAFGGLCVHCQILSIAKKAGLSLKAFFCWRPIYCAISLGVGYLLCSHITFVSPAFFVFGTQAGFASKTPLSAVFLLILSATLLCCDKKTAIIKTKAKSRT